MRTTLDLPDDLMRQLKARAALEGRSLRDVVLELVQAGLRAGREVGTHAAPHMKDALPTVGTGKPLPLARALFTNADLMEIANSDEG